MSELVRIPLFPLPLSVLPGQVVPLHVFEERFKKMINECIAEGVGKNAKLFGISRLEGDGLSTYGCTLRVVEVLNRYDDGRLDLLATGEKRFRIDSLVSEQEYYEGNVELLDDNVVVEPELREKVITLHKEMSLLAGAPYKLREDTPLLSFESAVAVGLEDTLRQQLLVLREERDRLVWLTEVYEGACEQLKRHELAKITPTLKKGKQDGGVGQGGHYIH